jgi:hypothetical protein
LPALTGVARALTRRPAPQFSSDAEASADRPPEPRSRLLVPPWAALVARPAGMYVASRLVVFVSFWTASRIVPNLGLASTFTAWDGGWYLLAARSGYPQSVPVVDGHAAQSVLAFFPLYPICVRAVHGVFGVSFRTAGMLVAGAAGLVAVILLRMLLERMWGPEAADRGVTVFCFFPGALVLSLTYSEPLMLALSIGCLLALLRRRWLVAGLLAALTTATRPNAVALVAACAWASLSAIRSDRDWRSLAAPVLAPAGFLAFQAFLWAHTGRIDAWWLTQRDGWGERLSVTATWDKVSAVVRHPLADVNLAVAVAGTVFIVVTLVLLVRARPPGPVLVYTAGVVLLALCSKTLGARPRFVLTAFPLVVVLGRWLRGNAFAVVAGCCAAILGSFAIVSVASLLITP